MAAYTLYGNFLSAPSYKAALALSLCGVDFTYRHVDLAKGAHKAPEYLAINRFGQVPALLHDGRAIAQSDVILLHVADATGKFGGRDADERLRIMETQHWEADRLHGTIGRLRFFTRFMKQEPPVMDLFRKNSELALAQLDGLLNGRLWLVGDGPTMADVSCYAIAQQAGDVPIPFDPWPNLTAWCGRVEALPGFLPWTAMPKADKG